MKISIKLTIFFEGIFWVGVFERVYEGKYEVARVVFGSEPKDYQVYDYILKNFYNLRFSNSSSFCETDKIDERKMNPKRLQREIKKETKNTGIGTKAQLAVKLQYESSKAEKKKISMENRKEEERKKFELKQQKKIIKHRGH